MRWVTSHHMMSIICPLHVNHVSITYCAAAALRRLPVPNMIADLDQAPKERVDKPVWRVAFFGRLEERKGIKLFVDAVQVTNQHARMCCLGV